MSRKHSWQRSLLSQINATLNLSIITVYLLGLYLEHQYIFRPDILPPMKDLSIVLDVAIIITILTQLFYPEIFKDE